MALLKILGIDPAFANFGMVRATIDTSKFQIVSIDAMSLTETVKTKDKRKKGSFDDIDRGRKLWNLFKVEIECNAIPLVIAEIPGGSQSSRAATTLGISKGIICCSPVPIVRVTPQQVKKTINGTNKATKNEVIEWAYKRFPNADWFPSSEKELRNKSGNLPGKNEHLADAIAVIETGLRTLDFKLALAELNVTNP